MLQLNYKHIKSANEVFKRLNQLRRWTDIVSSGVYNELSKQALNCTIVYILACFVEASGKVVVWERFPKIALWRAFQKVFVVFNTPESKYDEIFELGGISKSQFTVATKEKIAEQSDIEFANFLFDSIGTEEETLYKAATKIATYIEFLELSNRYSAEFYGKKLTNILNELSQFENIPGFNALKNTEGNLFKLLQFVSNSDLRHHIRWCEVGYVQECSILGHLFDTACFAYFMSLEEEPNDEKLAAQRFFMGIFHDIAEAWTTDIPSPIKDSISGFRKACELYEEKMLLEHFYSQMPDFLKEKIREVMFEDEMNVDKHKALIKGADYLSADAECWRQYVKGSRDPYFMDAIDRRIPGIESGKVALTPCCKKLFDFFRLYASRLHLNELNEDPNDL